MDFITALPELNGYNSILLVVDRLTKMAYYIPTCEDTNSEIVAHLYFDNIFHLYGLSDSIISNLGTQFTSTFCYALCKLVGISQNYSTIFYSQTDGQTERVSAILE